MDGMDMAPAGAILESKVLFKTRVAHPLTIAVINNMPDAAVQTTERQFCNVIAAASQGMVVKLKFYSLPGIYRSTAVQAHIQAYYDDFAELGDDPPDGLIVTGCEPKCGSLTGDPCYEPIAALTDWAVDNAISGVWSCLAAHVAVMHMDGIERRKLPRKLSGVYECRFNGRSSPFLHGLPPKWRVPHSRYNELPATELSAHGYAILSRSAEANVDVFCRKQGAVQLFFQGHPEYEPDSLLREYRRDVRRFLAGESEQFPAVPQHCVAAEGAEELQRLAVAAKRWRNPDLLTGFDAVLARQTPANHWFTAARTLYMNWLAYLATRRAEATGAKPYTALPRLFAPNHALATAQGAG